MAPSDFSYLLLKHGEGARYKFEEACEKAMKAEFKDATGIEAFPGDDGIDIYVGNMQDPIEVYQCKFFIQKIEDAQKKQVRKSFNTSINSENYTLKKWVLCIPKKLTITEAKWWDGWKKRTEKKYPKVKIDLFDSADLLSLIRKNRIDEDIFDLEERRQIREMHEHLVEKKSAMLEVLSPPDDLDYSKSVFVEKLKSAKIDEGVEICEKQFYNSEILKREIDSKQVSEDINELKSLTENIHELWFTQFLKHKTESDGNKLLGEVNEVIERENNTALRTKLLVSLTQKKGIVHQLADECQVGWVKDYKKVLKKYLDGDK
ncbi:MAG: hypothetical protein RLO12_05225 [Fulvivirga sp.]|uniref:ABC-three component system protein n=1 Tax=Marinoscillum sp. TaxID=2024838 RepID=UPI0032FCAB94